MLNESIWPIKEGTEDANTRVFYNWAGEHSTKRKPEEEYRETGEKLETRRYTIMKEYLAMARNQEGRAVTNNTNNEALKVQEAPTRALSSLKLGKSIETY